MDKHSGLLPNTTIDKDEHDELFHAKRVIDAGSDDQIFPFATVAGITYIGRGARGLPTSSDGWLITKIDETGDPVAIQHAIGILDNKESLTYS